MRVVTFLLKAVEPGGEPLLGVEVVVGGAGLEDVEEGQALVGIPSLMSSFRPFTS